MERSLDSRLQDAAKNFAVSSTNSGECLEPRAPVSNAVSQGSNLTALVVPEAITSSCVEQFAIPVPDTEWRQTYRTSYARFREIREQVKKYEVSLTKPHEPGQSAHTSVRQEISQRVEEYKKSLIDSWRKEYAPLNSGGTRVVEGARVLESIGQLWGVMDAASYCFLCLRRDRIIDFSKGGAVGLLIAAGYYPVTQPEDFDVIVYGEIIGEPRGKDFKPHHLGMWKDGLVISKDTRSLDVYHHPLEESAAHASHVMFFRHSKYPNPCDGPNWNDENRYRLFDSAVPACLQGIAIDASLQQSFRRPGVFSALSSWLQEMKGCLSRWAGRRSRD